MSGKPIELSTNLKIGVSKPIDEKYGPYSDTDEATTLITGNLRYQGLTVGIISGGTIEEYWWKEGVADNQLILKTVDTDNLFGPYADEDTANSTVTGDDRYQGLTVGIDDGSGLVEYWWKDGTGNDDLEPKTAAVDTSSFIESQPLSNSINYMRRLTQVEYDALFDSPASWQADTVYVIVG